LASADLTAARESLRRHWGFADFRPGQDRAVEAVLAGRHTLALFPTGGGKSLCYQVPATVLPGLTLVISPLVALMQDQVDALGRLGIPAAFINSTLSQNDVEQRLVNARNGMYTLLYCAPERLETSLFQTYAPSLKIALVAVDEAHCISEWGHEFRPPYRRIRANLAVVAPQARWLALTATATPPVRQDILETLAFEDPAIVSLGFSRPNLKWWVIETERKVDRLLDMVKKAQGSGLVYAATRRGCAELANRIRGLGIACEPYHAGLTAPERKRIQQQWIVGTLPVVVATNAFGMGIDKPDCRWVIHHDMPQSLEAYYQEAGRAGRDGQRSYPTLLVKRSDASQTRSRIDQGYPTRAHLQTVYDVTADTLNLAVGSVLDEGRYVTPSAVAERGKLRPRDVILGWQSLARFGILEADASRQTRIGIRFLISLDGMRDRIGSEPNPRKKSFLDGLFRLFGAGSIDAMGWLDEPILLQHMGVSHNALIKGLNVLRSDGWLEYESSEGAWLLRMMAPRMRDLPLRETDVNRHRDRQLEQFRHMDGYVSTKGCRTAYIRRYFGETDVPDACGFCDRCLDAGDAMAAQPAFAKTLLALCASDVSVADLEQATGVSRKAIKPILTWLQKEGRITIGPDGIRRV
jgi:ATP-dependent DNA helicase RecQ